MNSFFKFFFLFVCLAGIFTPITSSAQSPYHAKGWQGIIIKEVLPNPIDKDQDKEWIKLYNLANYEINLSGWVLADRFGKNHFFVFQDDLWLEDDDYVVLHRSQTQITLNNFEEELSLFNPAGELVDQVSYINAPEGKTLIYHKNDWQWDNKQDQAEPQNKEKEVEQGIEGIVITLPNQISSQYFFISTDREQSKTMQIYNYDKVFPNLKLGDKIKVFGQPSEIKNYSRLKIKQPQDIKIIEHQKLITPIATTDLDSNIGKIINISGTVQDKDGKYLILDNSIRIDPEFIEDKPKAGEYIQAAGMVLMGSKYKYVRILPDYNHGKINQETSNQLIVFSALGALSLAGLISLKARFD